MEDVNFSYQNHLFNNFFECHTPLPWKETEVITLPKTGKDKKFPQNLFPVSLLSTADELFGENILKVVQSRVEEKNLLHAGQFGFRAHHSTTLQCLKLPDHVALNFSNSSSTAVILLDTEKTFDTIWQSSLLYKLSDLQFATSKIKLISSFGV
jgi:hypothetical protein